MGRQKLKNIKKGEMVKKMNNNWKQKLTSRKFWAAVVGFVTAIATAFGFPELGEEACALIISGCAALAAFIIGEGIADAGRANAGTGTDNITDKTSAK